MIVSFGGIDYQVVGTSVLTNGPGKAAIETAAKLALARWSQADGDPEHYIATKMNNAGFLVKSVARPEEEVVSSIPDMQESARRIYRIKKHLKPDIIDRDGDGKIYDGTSWERFADVNQNNYVDLYPGHKIPPDQAQSEISNSGMDYYFQSKDAAEDYARNAENPVYLGGRELRARPNRNNWSRVAGIIDRNLPLFFKDEMTEHSDFFNDLTAEQIIDEDEYEQAMQEDAVSRGVQSGYITFRQNNDMWWFRLPALNDRTIDSLRNLLEITPSSLRGMPAIVDVEPTGRWKSRLSLRVPFDEAGLVSLYKEIGKQHVNRKPGDNRP